MKEIPLRDDPSRPEYTGPSHLERALAVVSFTPVAQLGVSGSELVASFQDAIRQEYPFFEMATDSFINVQVQDGGVASTSQEDVRKWLFKDIDRHWTVTLTRDAIALESVKAGYTTWPSFVKRIEWLVEQLQAKANPSHVLRLGVRYLNAATINEDSDPRTYCAQQLVSITGDPDVELADLFWVFGVAEGQMALRSGVMPPKSSYDPAFYAPRDERAWYLDIDVINSHTTPFEAKAIAEQLFQQASRVHAVYYWAMQAGNS